MGSKYYSMVEEGGIGMLGAQICKLLKIEIPIIQGGMAWVSEAELAAAVSMAGGLGIIAAGNMPPELVQREIRKAKTLTNSPFGVNVYYLSPYVEEVIDVVIAERVPVITTGAGNPGKHLKTLQSMGIRVIPVVSSVALAKRLERNGVDAVIAEGMECGGHIGELTTMSLVPQVVDAVAIPVIAAGGIADGRGVAAAFALGASGIQIGTRFVCSEECRVHDNYKQAIIKAKDRDTVITGQAFGHPVRVLRNKLTREMQELEVEQNQEGFEKLGTGKLKAAVVDGDVQNGSVMAGQISGLITEVLPVKRILSNLITEAEAVLKNLSYEI